MLASAHALRQLSDNALLERLAAENHKGRGVLAELLRLLAEVDSRKLYLGQGFPSLFSFATGALGLSEDEAAKRVHACRAGRTYPVILELVEKGELHLTAINMLAPHLTEENHATVLAAACRKSKRELEILVTSLSPKPDAASRLWRLHERPALNIGAGERVSPLNALDGEQGFGLRLPLATPGSAAAAHTTAPSRPDSAPVCSGETNTPRANLTTIDATTAPGVSTAPSFTLSASTPSAQAAKTPRGTVTPLSPERFRLQVTLSRAGRDALLRAQELCRRENPSGELAVVLEKAICAYVEELERKRFAKRRRPLRPAPTSSEATADSQSKRDTSESGLQASASEHVPERIDSHKAAQPRVQPAPTQTERATLETTHERQKASEHVPERTGADKDAKPRVQPAPAQTERATLETAHEREKASGHVPERTGADRATQPRVQPAPAQTERAALETTHEREKASEHVPERTGADKAAMQSAQPACRPPRRRDRTTSEPTTQREKPCAKRSRHIPRAIRRAVFERDSFQCTFVGPSGRCSERAGLELHHLRPFARGGEHSVDGLAVRCRAHNMHQAILDFGAEVVAAAVQKRRGSGRPTEAGGSESP